MDENGTALYSVTASWKSETTQSMPLNTTTNNSCLWPKEWQWLLDIQPVFLWFLAIVGAVENLFVLSVLCFHKSRCTVAEIYLANLAAADLLLLCGLPFWAVNITSNFQWPFGLPLCKAINTILYMNLYSSIYFLVMVSIDRYLALVKTMSLGRMRRPWCAKLNCFIIWVSALFLCSPALIFRSLKYVPEYNITACMLDYPSLDQWVVITNTLLNTVGFLMPLCVIIYCTIQIIQALQKNEFQNIKAIQTEKKATILVLSVLLLFIICWLPFQITTFLETLRQIDILPGCANEQALDVATQIATYCSFSNSCLNPIVYVLVGKHFRKKSKELYSRMIRRRPSAAPSVQIMTTMETIRMSFSVENHRKKSAVNLPR
ncbi:B2 bradykinin receptor [Sceloporus undulatus]|uniref:B2 bradykinin receptor n=1 Tax=Sceloporus undulatus TaxID=8520 RepID=UPI001C4BDF20|nr:B2 bradykinin receptor [Sceloporus undulatus]XP_042300823.1 B2 bradykinin receptor [Sceloporus undulatus]XP_042300824.1 B2 bradykinin receptor [Sceloporus undulatus]XP_042300825.1 B2 bradykinin receptor [Sceloporus undulatus]XP_042300826.1 B2 bradykinin receptor [Sceloporus undulatus]